MEFTKYKLTNN